MNGGKKARNGGKSVHPKMGVGLGWRLWSTPQAASETPAIPAGCPQIWDTHVTRAIASLLLAADSPRIPGGNEHCRPSLNMDKENRWCAELQGPSSELTSVHERCTRDDKRAQVLTSVHER